ncbi:MAG TPA: multicopper oxidase domain-containing protein [Cerasibacillus sp.]|uniref:multicopper oxidase family protein n=1 Tax=Cerasibacillus sp. TaxID=2498711 RepID=UPI002F3E4044
MKNRMNRITLIILVLALMVGAFYLYHDDESQASHDTTSRDKSKENAHSTITTLPIPEILEDQNPDEKIAEYNLTAQKSTNVFVNGVETETYGYNGNYLGPVIKARNGEEITVNIKNALGDEETTVHWHGLEIPGDVDGGPHQVIQPNESLQTTFTINQPAATLWYHPHPLHKTGKQVYKGLAGLLLIEDEVSDKLPIPKDYGRNDFPLVIQDRQLNQNGKLIYDLNMMDVMHGKHGDTPLVNGANDALLEVPRGKVRLRFLNGSNARTNQLHLKDELRFWQIASDGGFLEKPVKRHELILGASERAEVIVDFSSYKEGERIELFDQNVRLMTFIVGEEPDKETDIPEQLTTIKAINPEEATKSREFVLQGMGHMVNINGKQMDIHRIDEEVNLDETEIWDVSNPNGRMAMEHPFHVHGVQFQILERNGEEPPENERGWKDTVLLMPGENVKLIATFKHKGTFMYHCHILEHEDAGMMGQFQVD